MKQILCLIALLLVGGCAPKTHRSMKSLPALRVLLTELSAVEVDHPEISDSLSRDSHYRPALDAGFIHPVPGFVVPDNLGMNTPEANARVRTVLQRFLKNATLEATAMGLTTPRQRLDAFEDITVQVPSALFGSRMPVTYDHYFGSSK